MFEDAVFLDEKFSPDVFVSTHRRDKTLEVLRKDLEEYVEGLDNALVNIINNDYSAFLRLSSMLVDIDSLVLALHGPLDQLESKVVAVRDVISDPLQTQKALLDRLLYVQEKKKMIQLCLSAWEILEKVQFQLQQLKKDDADHEGTGERDPGHELQESNGETLGRASQRLARVSFLAQENSTLPLLRMIRAKSRSLEHSLLEELDKALVQAVMAEDRKPIAVVLRAYVAINQSAQAGQIFKNKVVKPYLEDLFTPGKLHDGGSRGDFKGLKAIYATLLTSFVQTTCRPVLDAVHDPSEGLGNVDFITTVCEGVSETIIKDHSSMYSSGVADILHSTFTTTEAFFKVLETFAPDRERIRDIAAETLSHWNMSIYIQLRQQEVLSKRLESSLQQQIETKVLPSRDILALEGSKTLLACVDDCWSDRIYLEGVKTGIFKLVLELLSRYLEWSSLSVQFNANVHDVQSGEVVPQSDESVKSAWGKVLEIDSLLFITHDCRVISGKLNSQVGVIQRKLFPATSGEAVSEDWQRGMDAVTRALGILHDDLLKTGENASSVLQQFLVKNCTHVLTSAMKAVAPVYRMKNKAAPTLASSYCAKVVEPLRVFLCGEKAMALLNEDERDECVVRVLTDVFTAFRENCKNILDEVKNSENAMRRLKRTTEKLLGSEKIQMQFRLDLESITDQAMDLTKEDLKAKMPLYEEVLESLS